MGDEDQLWAATQFRKFAENIKRSQEKRCSHDLSDRTQIGRIYLLLHDAAFMATGVGNWHTLAEVEGVVGARTRTVWVECPQCGCEHGVELSNDFYTARNRVSELKLDAGPEMGFTIRSKKPERGSSGKIHRYRMEKLNADAEGV